MKYFIGAALALLMLACNKFDDLQEEKEADSGLVRVQRKGSSAFDNSARIGEEIEVYAKVGKPGAALQFYIGDIASTPSMRESRIINVVNFFEDNDSTLVPVEVFTFKVPEGAKVGVTNVYFTVNGVKHTPVFMTILKPDILYPGKVTVSPFIKTKGSLSNEKWIDGPVGTATMKLPEDIVFDRNTETLYSLEDYSFGGLGKGYGYVIRQIKDNMITTIGGGGTDPEANGTERALMGRSGSAKMILGPDGKLYIGINTIIKVRNFQGIDVFINRPEIIRFDPASKQFSPVAGGRTRKAYTADDTYSGMEDGKENATLLGPTSLAFDKHGHLYFLDFGAVLRKVAPDGTVSTLLGKVQVTENTRARDMITNQPIVTKVYRKINERTDGFGDEVRFKDAQKIVVAGNGNIYLHEGQGVHPTNMHYVREINPETKETATIAGKPEGLPLTMTYTGTFKEVELSALYSFDVDYDGNIVFSTKPNNLEAFIYKMDLQQETIVFLAGGATFSDESIPQPGVEARFREPLRIVFDQFGTLYTADREPYFIKKIEVER
jgi:hypothetical protein